jgi:NADH-quinone oxidoreductase subunit C
MLTNETIKQRLIDKFGEEITNFTEPYGMLTFEAPKDMNLKVLQFLFDDDELKFRFLTDLQAVHYPDQKERELAVVYQHPLQSIYQHQHSRCLHSYKNF